MKTKIATVVFALLLCGVTGLSIRKTSANLSRQTWYDPGMGAFHVGNYVVVDDVGNHKWFCIDDCPACGY